MSADAMDLLQSMLHLDPGRSTQPGAGARSSLDDTQRAYYYSPGKQKSETGSKVRKEFGRQTRYDNLFFLRRHVCSIIGDQESSSSSYSASLTSAWTSSASSSIPLTSSPPLLDTHIILPLLTTVTTKCCLAHISQELRFHSSENPQIWHDTIHTAIQTCHRLRLLIHNHHIHTPSVTNLTLL